ncbi:mismatch-specific DNA-glycosylase [Myxococcus virescens]|uniref:Mismatch-specific DNA-glycosylase n=2 Tax=Myxococcus virescens TaxID=83456 RepID=A0A511HH52_9BACT|nr:G/U mismatch-specific DNA glycosylase [Myxococcus virescens]GEL72704.1 mismatch-specific DNA-glycosylase [Myxococcus virescens]
MTPLRRPSRDELDAATGRTMPDVIAPRLRVLFCGINPSLYSAVVGYHFARPGNRFWPTLHAAGITPHTFQPTEQASLLALGYGITNVVDRATATADLLNPAELARGAKALEAKVARYQPRFLAVLGVSAYRIAFGRPKAALGAQPERLGDTRLWVLPNPSGLNAHYQLDALGRLFGELRRAVEQG